MNKTRSLGNGVLFVGDLEKNTPAREYQQIAIRIWDHTIAYDGGTFDVNEYDHTRYDYSVPVDGYAVGGALDTVKVPLTDPWFKKIDAIAYFIHKIPRGRDLKRKHFLGTWIEDGYLWIDATDIIRDADEAFDTARRRGEIAVYDGVNEIAINVDDWYASEAAELSAYEDKIERELRVDMEDVVFGHIGSQDVWYAYVEPVKDWHQHW